MDLMGHRGKYYNTIRGKGKICFNRITVFGLIVVSLAGVSQEPPTYPHSILGRCRRSPRLPVLPRQVEAVVLQIKTCL